MAGSWPEVLDDIEASIVLYETTLETGVVPSDLPGIPEGLGPIPPELADRAAALYSRLHALEEQFVQARDLVAALLSLAGSITRPDVVPYYVDTTA